MKRLLQILALTSSIAPILAAQTQGIILYQGVVRITPLPPGLYIESESEMVGNREIRRIAIKSGIVPQSKGQIRIYSMPLETSAAEFGLKEQASLTDLLGREPVTAVRPDSQSRVSVWHNGGGSKAVSSLLVMALRCVDDTCVQMILSSTVENEKQLEESLAILNQMLFSVKIHGQPLAEVALENVNGSLSVGDDEQNGVTSDGRSDESGQRPAVAGAALPDASPSGSSRLSNGSAKSHQRFLAIAIAMVIAVLAVGAGLKRLLNSRNTGG